ncbi:MAG: hypothetical protein KC912_14395 [Proteobacteria bacterium]|nr:hypothetical protein [Pseudomonadota bacterium]
MRVLLLLWAVVCSPLAHAASDCEPLQEEAFRTLFLDALAAIDRDDAALHASIVEEVRGRIECLTFAPPPRLWADFLVGVAVVEFSHGGEWEGPMAAALRIRPNVDRLVSGAHPLNRWEPPVQSEVWPPAPEGVVLYVDGELSETLPPAGGMYLVQKEEEGWFETRWLHGEAVDPAWVSAPVERPRRTETWLYASGGVAIGALGQTASYVPLVEGADVPEFSDYAANGYWVGLMPLASVDGLLQYGRLGLLGHADISWAGLSRSTAGTAYAGPSFSAGPLVASLGFGVQSFEIFEGGCRVLGEIDEPPGVASEDAETCVTEATPRSVPLAYGYGRMWLRTTKPWIPEPMLLIGAGPTMGRFEASVGVEPPPSRRGARWRYTATTAIAVANFGREEATYALQVVPYNIRIGLRVGAVLGRVR